MNTIVKTFLPVNRFQICEPMRRVAVAVCAVLSVGASWAAEPRGYDVAAYVWPAYQDEPRWKELGIFGDGMGEWQNLYEATKRQTCDYQGMKPLWVI